jgi:hypothetical protein
MKAWTIGLSASFGVDVFLCLAAAPNGEVAGSTPDMPVMIFGVLLIALPLLAAAIVVAVFLGREISKDIRKERAWKATLTPGQRTAVQVAETAALFAAWGVVHESVVKGREREAARVDQRQADRARQAVQQRCRPRGMDAEPGLRGGRCSDPTAWTGVPAPGSRDRRRGRRDGGRRPRQRYP